MHRRDFLMLTAAVSLAPALVPTGARASGALAYSPQVLDAARASGRPVFLDFTASWCGTCKAQARVISALKAENPAYESAITFIDVDWDTWKNDMIVAEMNIPRRSTLVVLKGDAEIGRIVAGTSRADIKALMDAALAVA